MSGKVKQEISEPKNYIIAVILAAILGGGGLGLDALRGNGHDAETCHVDCKVYDADKRTLDEKFANLKEGQTAIKDAIKDLERNCPE